jgi:hypothetical protein
MIGWTPITPAERIMPMVKTLARALLPDSLYETIRAVRWRRYLRNSLKNTGLLDAAKGYVERNGTTVKYGPFSGTIYPLETALGRHSIPMLLGTYEEELHDTLRTILGRQYDLVIDVGSAEGYYAVGFARTLGTKVLAYDTAPNERKLCSAAALINGVSDLVENRGLFSPADLKLFKDKRVLFICDCEGFEAQLFTSDTLQCVAKWDLLIELHGGANAKLQALTWPHKVSPILAETRVKRYSELDGLGDQAKLLSEYRDGTQTWLWCDGRVNAMPEAVRTELRQPLKAAMRP